VISGELIQYYGSLGGRPKAMPEEETPILRVYAAELRDTLEARVILRDLRNRAGIPPEAWKMVLGPLSGNFPPAAVRRPIDRIANRAKTGRPKRG
jgi:hypothetical protein